LTAKNAKVTKEENGNAKEGLTAENAKEHKREAMRDMKVCATRFDRQHTIFISIMGMVIWKKVYENALAHRLRKAGLDVKQRYPLTVTVYDEDGTLLGITWLIC
jgi:hypothetical protein